jgi:hypothetical protein
VCKLLQNNYVKQIIVALKVNTTVNDCLLQAMVLYQKTGQRQNALGYLSLAENLTESEVLGVYSFALDYKPSTASAESIKQCYSLCEAFTRLELKQNFPQHWPLIVKWVDEVLVQVLQAAKSGRTKPSVFCATHSSVLSCLMDPATMGRILGHTGAFKDIEADLVEVVHGSRVGAKLFACATQQVFGEMITREISDAIDLLMKTALITATTLTTAQQMVLKKIRSVQGMEAVSDRRPINLSYRGRLFSYHTKHLADEIDMSFMAHLKSSAVNCGDLPAVCCELMLADGGPPGVPGQIAECVLGRCRAARAQVNTSYAGMSSKKGSDVVAFLTRNRKANELTDHTFTLELQFFVGMVGKDGERALFSMVSLAMPTATTAVSVGHVLQEVRAIQQKDVFKFCDESAQNQITAVANLLDDIDSGRCPKFAANASSWLVSIKESLKFFCRVTEGTTELVGAAAAKKMATQVLAVKNTKNMSLSVLENPTKYAWLLSAAQKTAVAALRQTVLEQQKTLATAVSTGSSSKGKSTASSSKAAASTSKAVRKGATELEMAMAMFKGASA